MHVSAPVRYTAIVRDWLGFWVHFLAVSPGLLCLFVPSDILCLYWLCDFFYY